MIITSERILMQIAFLSENIAFQAQNSLHQRIKKINFYFGFFDIFIFLSFF